jgi:hypothetical protein
MRSTFVLAVSLLCLTGTVHAQAPNSRPKPDTKQQQRQLIAKRKTQRTARYMSAKMREQAKIDMLNKIAAENQKQYMALLPYLLEQERLNIMRMSAEKQAQALKDISRSIDQAAFQNRLNSKRP